MLTIFVRRVLWSNGSEEVRVFRDAEVNEEKGMKWQKRIRERDGSAKTKRVQIEWEKERERDTTRYSYEESR